MPPARSSTSRGCLRTANESSVSTPPTESDRLMTTNQQIHLVSRPTGEASAENFKLFEVEVPELEEGQVLVRHHFLSLDPYMRGRMNDAKSYAVPQPLNAVMQGGTAGEVAASKSPHYVVGDKVVGFGGWQQYSVNDAATQGLLRKVDTA